ncbi:glutathione S-transferase family protein [Arenibacterium halophilum]|uniref:Glutathione S-transferase family protein n=1 Tax=Arenibacterium halophilum TaxID=2583821 RepID=A0ABY2WX60_9RHOB|nr:glutathione S-transferase family protein [Arenibacterium halophilum]TMV07378.1 glutathione S-transferase family protein [Arenibacterium halophilum]
MATLYHSPHSRSDTIVTLVKMLNADIDIRGVTITRQDGSGAPDPENPHPEKKVPYLVDGAEAVRERGAIVAYLTDAYPAAKLGPLPGEAGRGAYLSWLFYYQGIMEPLLILHWTGFDHPAITASLRDLDTMAATLAKPLGSGPWLLGDRFSAADMLCSSPFAWFPDLLPDHATIQDWVKRCGEQTSGLKS